MAKLPQMLHNLAHNKDGIVTKLKALRGELSVSGELEPLLARLRTARGDVDTLLACEEQASVLTAVLDAGRTSWPEWLSHPGILRDRIGVPNAENGLVRCVRCTVKAPRQSNLRAQSSPRFPISAHLLVLVLLVLVSAQHAMDGTNIKHQALVTPDGLLRKGVVAEELTASGLLTELGVEHTSDRLTWATGVLSDLRKMRTYESVATENKQHGRC